MITVVILDDTAELFATFNLAFERRREIDVEDVISDVFAPVWSTRIIIIYPDRIDVVKMVQAEAEEIIQTFAF